MRWVLDLSLEEEEVLDSLQTSTLNPVFECLLHSPVGHLSPAGDPGDISTTAQCPLAPGKSKDRVSLLSLQPPMAHLVSDFEPSLADQHAVLSTEPVCHGWFSAVLVSSLPSGHKLV